MSKRPPIDLMALTSTQAVPMPEAAQRTAPQAPRNTTAAPAAPVAAAHPDAEHVPTANLQALAFKVPPAFRKRFRERAASADLKLNELLFAAFAAWEAQNPIKK